MMNQSTPPVRAAGVVLLRLLLVSWVTLALFISRASSIGVNFGQVANNLPSNEVTVQLVKTTTISKLKIYSPDPAVLTAFAGSGIDLVVGTDNDEIQPMASTDGYAFQWVHTNIAAYPNTSIVGIALGNEVLSYLPELISFLLPALQNLQAALASVGLDKTVKVSTPNSLGIVAQSFPPSDGQFYDYNGNTMGPLLEFYAQTGAPFMVNIYPFFAYDAAPENISLDYVLFGPNAVPVHDSGSGLTYTNMFDAQVDAVYAAMSKLGYDNVSLAVTETGWPSAGDADQAGATVANAQVYIANLVKHIESGVGTPAKPGVTVDTLIFALYNENLKPGPTSERNFGLYNPDGTPMYYSGLTVSPQWYSPPPPVDALPPASTTPPPPPSFFTPPPGTNWPPPPPVALAPTAWPPPPVTPDAPQPPPVGWSPPPPAILVSPPPPTPVTPQPPPEGWSPPPPAVVGAPPPPTPVAPQPPPAGWSPPPPAVVGAPPPPTPVAPQPPPTGWSPPPAIVGSPPPTPIAPPPPPTGWAPSPDSPPPVADAPSPVTAPLAGPSLSPPAPASATPASSIVPDAPAPAPDSAGSPTNSTPSWCVAKANADAGQLQIALNWACSTGGANCSLLQSGGVCFTPNTLVAHASYAFDSYYSLNSRNSWDCFFSGTGVVTTVNPSFTGCVFP